MEGGLILETTFLVDLERELGRGTAGPAQRFLEAHQDDPLFITFTIAGELAAGVSREGRVRWESFTKRFPVLPCTADVCWHYGQIFRFLQANGRLIGANDLWIAASAIAFEKALVTRNAREFQRVPGLDLRPYRP